MPVVWEGRLAPGTHQLVGGEAQPAPAKTRGPLDQWPGRWPRVEGREMEKETHEEERAQGALSLPCYKERRAARKVLGTGRILLGTPRAKVLSTCMIPSAPARREITGTISQVPWSRCRADSFALLLPARTQLVGSGPEDREQCRVMPVALYL